MTSKGPFFTAVLGDSPTSFYNIFQSAWTQHLESFPSRYKTARQLVIGARFRPLLVAWGFLLSGAEFCRKTKVEVAELAVYIELLHKATLLVDDLIDDDSTRHGEKSFHVEFSDHEAILFAVYLIGDSLEKLSISAKERNLGERYSEMIELLSLAVKNMSYGGALEVATPDSELAAVSKAKDLIEMQTIALVKNGLMAGYKYGRGDRQSEPIIDNLGYDCGYLFQTLNDLEPYLNEKLNIEHKGVANIDTQRSRKNIITAFVFESLGHRGRETYLKLAESDREQLIRYLNDWFWERGVLECVLENMTRVTRSMSRNIELAPAEEPRKDDYRQFINYVLSRALERVGSSHGDRLSEILIT